ncbi:MAG: rhomboid family intramembrane serine protease [Chitinophagaceae bacterium]|nr:rhomboid family intramembrane serine protease [Chitinophagaceae bacterium]
MLSHTLIIILVTAAISISAFSNGRIYNDLIMYPPAIRKGQYYRLLTSGFIHADYMHLIFNMLTLWFFGKVLEQQYFQQFGKFTYLIFYLLAITVSDIPSYVKHRYNASYASLGASGGVSAMLFAFIILAPWSTIYIFFLPVPAIVFGVLYLVYSQYMANRGGDNINHDAHFWGAVFGIVGVLVLDRNAIPRFIELIQRPEFNF